MPTNLTAIALRILLRIEVFLPKTKFSSQKTSACFERFGFQYETSWRMADPNSGLISYSSILPVSRRTSRLKKSSTHLLKYLKLSGSAIALSSDAVKVSFFIFYFSVKLCSSMTIFMCGMSLRISSA